MRNLVLCLLLLSTAAWPQSLGQKLFEATWSRVESDFHAPDLRGLDSTALRAEAINRLSDVTDKEEAVAIINGYLGRLKTSHTHLYCDQDPLYFELLDIFATGPEAKDIAARFAGQLPHYTGILAVLEGDTVVDIVPGGPADLADLRVGDKVLGISDSPDGPFLPYHPIRSLGGKAGRELYLQVQSGLVIGPRPVVPIEIQPTQAFLQSITDSVEISQSGPYKLGYVRIYSYASEAFHERLQSLLEEGPLAEADGLVWDLRGGWGGAQPRYLETFQDLPRLALTGRDGSVQKWDSGRWSRPVVMVVNERSRSGKEILAHGFQKQGLGPLVGTRTAGAVSAGQLYLLPEGCSLYLAVASAKVDNEVLEGVGVEPDQEMREPILPSAEPSVKDRALERLLTEIEGQSRMQKRPASDPGV